MRDGLVADPAVPVPNRQLTGHDRGLSRRAIVDHFQQIASDDRIKRCHSPIVQ